MELGHATSRYPLRGRANRDPYLPPMPPRRLAGDERATDKEATVRVRDIMSSPVVAVPPERPLKEVVRLFDRHRVSALPVVEEDRVCGIVSKTDIVLREQVFERDAPHHRFARLVGRDVRSVGDATTAADVMTAPAVTVDTKTSAVGAAWLMAENDVHHLPVVDRGRLVGIVSRSDLVRAFARSDEQIHTEIVDEVLPSLDVSPASVAVAVTQGEVVLTGRVEDDAIARCLPHAVRAVLGVVDVRAELEPAHAPTVDRVTPLL